MSSAPKPFVFVTVGTDHHPFHRLTSWVDAWAGGADEVECLMQTGTSSPPKHVPWVDYLAYSEMEAALQRASVIVCHGGTGTIMLARHLGKVPLVVPRLHVHGEHVDDHQAAFARRLAAESEIELAETREGFVEVLSRLVATPPKTNLAGRTRTTASVRRFEELMSGLLGTP